MSTRSMICKEQPNGKYLSIYCHFDGYLEHNGIILDIAYNTEEKVNQLLGLGDLSILGLVTSPSKNKIHTFNNYQNNVCLAYGRDRGENNTEAKECTLKELFNNVWIEYFYIFTKDNKWIYSNSYFKNLKCNTEQDLLNTFTPLTQALNKECYKKDIHSIKKQLDKLQNSNEM